MSTDVMTNQKTTTKEKKTYQYKGNRTDWCARSNRYGSDVI